jgi:hypothetical protein
MLKLRVLQARFGDCFILEGGFGKRRKYVLVDGGPNGVYGPYLRGELIKISAVEGKLDLVVLTHVDADHILGLLELMAELKADRDHGQPPLVQVSGMWHNGFSKILPEAAQAADQLEKEMMAAPPSFDVEGEADPEAAVPSVEEGLWALPEDYGIKEGHQLQMLDAELGISRNPTLPDRLITLENAARPMRAAGMRLWILGPKQANLERLRKTWLTWLKENEISFGVTGELVKPDTSEANLSSIMFLAESGGRRILFSGDGLGDDVIYGLEQTGLMPPGGTIQVDILKLPHHGSARNAVGALFDRVLADIYIISADGKYGNPDRQTLDWLVDAACRQGRDIKIFATNNTAALEDLVRERPPQKNHYHLTVMSKEASSVVL